MKLVQAIRKQHQQKKLLQLNNDQSKCIPLFEMEWNDFVEKIFDNSFLKEKFLV